MRIYETIYICAPTLDDKALEEFEDQVIETIFDSGGRIIKRERWGKRRLAYTVRQFRDGIYYYILYGGDGKTKIELERRLKFAEPCIRYLTVRLDNELKGKKHKIYTKEELQLALQMEKPSEAGIREPKEKAADRQPAEKKQEATGEQDKSQPEPEESSDSADSDREE